MGITGLIPFLEKSSKKTNISEFSGGTVAIDTYCWLHKGAFSCADKIIMGQPTDAYVKYCMKFVNMLLSHNIKPILVFDGRHLPAKAETEIKRREARENNKKRAADLIKMGKVYEGKNILRRSLDVSHKMALEVIKECQAHNVDCIVAPYEADAQLAYLNISGIADLVITEDSDLTLFGCKKIFFKMDLCGNGVLVEQDNLHLAMGLRLPNFNMDKFRYMCILSGCDYLASLPGIGLGKACKFIVKNTDDNIYNALQRLSSSLNMKSLVVTKEYRDNFMRALITFKHQLVYCPIQRKQVRLHPPTPDVTEEQLIHAGSELQDMQLAWQLALGNCDPFTYEKLHNFDPDSARPKLKNSWSEIPVAKHISIWSKNFEIKNVKEKKSNVTPTKIEQLIEKRRSTRGQVAVMKTDSLKQEITPRKRTYEESDISTDEIMEMYKQSDSTSESPTKKEANMSTSNEPSSPVFVTRSNPFKKSNNSNEVSPSILFKTRRRLPVKGRFATVIDQTAIEQSKFFGGTSSNEIKRTEVMDTAETMTHISEKDCKENINSPEFNIIIPETEAYDDAGYPIREETSSKGNDYKESDREKEIINEPMDCDKSVTEKEPLHSINENVIQQNTHFKEEPDQKLEKKEIESFKNRDEEDKDPEFSITRQIFSEYQSSMFTYESPDKRPKRSSSEQSIHSSSQLSQRSSTRRNVKNNTKKPVTIQGQQNLLQMFGFHKKNSLKH